MTDELPSGKSRHSLVSSFRYACQGIIFLCRHERNFRLHIVIAISACVLAAAFQFSLVKWVSLLLTIGLVTMAEALNSAIEVLVDLVEPDQHPLAGRVKDLAAAGVLIAAIISVMIGVLLFVPPAWNLVILLLE